MELEEVCLVALAIATICEIISTKKKIKKHKRRHRCWVRPWIKDRCLENHMNTAFKLQKQLSQVRFYLHHN